MKHRIIIIMALALILSMSLILSGCGQKNSEEVNTSPSEDAAADSSANDLRVIGIKSGSNTFVTIKNKIGQDIEDIAIKSNAEKDYSAGLLAVGDSFRNNESRILYYTLTDDKNVTYDIRLSLADGSEAVLHAFPFSDTESCTIWMDGVAYIDYLSKSSGNKESTKTLEINTLIAQEEGISIEELNAKDGTNLGLAASPSPSPSATAKTATSTSGRTNYSGSTSYSGGSSYSGGYYSGDSTSDVTTDTDASSTTTDDSSSSSSDSGSSSTDNSGSSSVGGDEAYMDDDLSGSTVG